MREKTMPDPIPRIKLRARASDPVQLAVIGGGPKAVAIAAQAWAWHEEDLADVRVTVFEPEHVGAHWSGKAGYTDGEQPLCTLAERDVGYPYHSPFGKHIDTLMSARFSWARFLQIRPDGYKSGYSDWVDAGRKPPRHKHFAQYLQWAMAQSTPQAQVLHQRVTRLATEGKRWRVEASDTHGVVAPCPTRFDATIVTGPGPAKHVPQKIIVPDTDADAKIFDGRDFWHRPDAVRACLKKAREDQRVSENAIVIVGAGGTAAAILAWLVTHGAVELPILMVASQASLFTRVDSVFENRLFTDDTRWETLSPTSRRAFFDRLNRGVVWATVMDRVAMASNFNMVDGRAEQIEIAGANQIALHVRRGDGTPVTLQASMMIDCSGFDAWWFLGLIDGFPAAQSITNEQQRHARWQRRMNKNLQLQGVPWDKFPALHAPMLSSEIGPGFGSLMVLGAMAERVLSPHRFAPPARA